jgi:signal transduction histidine kinase
LLYEQPGLQADRCMFQSVLGTSRKTLDRIVAAWSGLNLADQFVVVGAAAVVFVAVIYGFWLEPMPAGRRSTLVVAVTFAVLGVLFMIVRRGSRTIESQQKSLRDRISQLSSLLAQNEALRQRIDDLYVRSAETHESFLRRVGHELHDGPAQLIAFALLRLDALRPKPGEAQSDEELADYERIKGALIDALADIRNISAGLILPELEAASPAEVLRLAARNHERRTGTRVRCEVDSLPMKLTPLLKSCLYRFTQAALNNAYQHAGGNGQAGSGTHRNGMVEIAVSDAGPGFLPHTAGTNGARLGLITMRDRVVSLGGTFDLSSKPGAGTRLTARFEVTEDARTEQQHG